MKYLRSFETEADYSAYTQSQEYVTPNVCLIKDEQTVAMNKYVPEPPLPTPESVNAIRFTLEPDSSSGKIYFSIHKNINTAACEYVEYSLNGVDWTRVNNVAGSTTFVANNISDLNPGESIYFRGKGTNYGSGYDHSNFYQSNQGMKYKCQGSIMTMLGLQDSDYLTYFNFSYLFTGMAGLLEAPVLPSPLLNNGSYLAIFSNCSNLRYIKMLATTIYTDGMWKPLQGWVNGVADSGTLVLAKNLSLPTGISGIPEGWTVVREDT